MIFDTHAHYDDAAFDHDRETVLASLCSNGITQIIDAASTAESLPKVMQLAENHDFIHAAIGIHPDEIGSITDELWNTMHTMLKNPKTAAVGEIGLDYHWHRENKAQQIDWFRRQIRLAQENDKPVIVHSRDAAEDTLTVIRECYADQSARFRGPRATEPGTLVRPGVIHCYAYSPEMAKIYTDMGFFLGIGGVVTYKNARKLKETVAQTDLSHLVLETDCPYLAPEPFRGTRNSSLRLPLIIKTIAEIKGVSENEVEEKTYENAKQLFRAG